MRTEIRIVGACLFAVIVTGCDINIFGEKRKESRMESGTTNMRLENMRLETESQRASMTEYAKGRLSLFKSRLDVISKDAASVREDFSKLTTEVVAIMDEKDSKGQDQKYETKILHILRNATVNAFAQKYLATDFSGIVATYKERVRDARAADAKYAAAVQDVEAMYKANIAESKKWSNMTDKQRKEEILRLQNQISALEKRRKTVQEDYKNSARHSMLGGYRQELQRREAKDVVSSKVIDIDKQIAVKRKQIDLLTHPESQLRLANQTMNNTQSSQNRAVYTRKTAMYDVERRLKPKKSTTEVVAEVEADTIEKLRKVMSDKISTLENESKSLEGNIAKINEVLLQIPVSDIGELKSLKRRIDSL